MDKTKFTANPHLDSEGFNLNMSHVYLRRDLTERRHRARAANEPGIKVFGYEAFNNAGAHINSTTDAARCEGCTPQACTWTDLSDEEIEAQHRHWQTMGNGWSGA